GGADGGPPGGSGKKSVGAIGKAAGPGGSVGSAGKNSLGAGGAGFGAGAAGWAIPAPRNSGDSGSRSAGAGSTGTVWSSWVSAWEISFAIGWGAGANTIGLIGGASFNSFRDVRATAATATSNKL